MPKSTPVRQCAACRTKRNKEELLRIVRSPEGTISLDRSHKASGRGAYLCRDIRCIRKAQKIGALSRALDVPIPERLWAPLEKETEGSNG